MTSFTCGFQYVFRNTKWNCLQMLNKNYKITPICWILWGLNGILLPKL